MVIKKPGEEVVRCHCEDYQLLWARWYHLKRLKVVQELNSTRLNLFTERNNDGTGYLILRGNDLQSRWNRRLKDSDIRAICRYLKESKRKITRVDLSYNSIGDEGFFELLKRILIQGYCRVQNLNMMNNNITEKSIENLANYAKYIKLKYLRLNGNDFGVKGGEHFARFLVNNKSVEYVDIAETSITLTDVAHIITALRYDHGGNSTVKVFDFSRIVPLFNRYNYETKWLAYHIEYLLTRNKSVIELHLQKNQFISHDMEYLDRGLRQNTTLLYLDLGYNRIGDYGIELIAKYLAKKPQLLFLNVAGNGISNTGARALSFGLPYSKVRALDIGKNNLSDDGIIDLLNTIRKVYFLRFLNIWGNKITHDTCALIVRYLEAGILFQHTLDVKVYEVDEVLYAAYYPNPADRNKHIYYNELEYGFAQPIYHITRNIIHRKKVKVDCKQRHKLDKTDRDNF